MTKNPFKFVSLLAGLCLCATLAQAQAQAQAQEDMNPAPKKPVPKALQEAKAKARAKRLADKAKADAEAKAKAVDINRASKEELMKIPGITGPYADAIVAKRPYKSKADLVTKNAIPNGTYQGIRKLVAAK